MIRRLQRLRRRSSSRRNHGRVPEVENQRGPDLEAGQLHFAASTPNLMGGAEIGEFEGLSDDPASGLVVTKGCLKVSDTPGLGVEIDLSKARETTI